MVWNTFEKHVRWHPLSLSNAFPLFLDTPPAPLLAYKVWPCPSLGRDLALLLPSLTGHPFLFACPGCSFQGCCFSSSRSRFQSHLCRGAFPDPPVYGQPLLPIPHTFTVLLRLCLRSSFVYKYVMCLPTRLQTPQGQGWLDNLSMAWSPHLV